MAWSSGKSCKSTGRAESCPHGRPWPSLPLSPRYVATCTSTYSHCPNLLPLRDAGPVWPPDLILDPPNCELNNPFVHPSNTKLTRSLDTHPSLNVPGYMISLVQRWPSCGLITRSEFVPGSKAAQSNNDDSIQRSSLLHPSQRTSEDTWFPHPWDKG